MADPGLPGGAPMSVPDEVLRPACEAAVEVARLGASAHPPLQVPGPLRPLTKLRTLPDRALPAVRKVLEDDQGFRSIVAASTTEDLVGRASWLFLHRPDGWEHSLVDEAGSVLGAAAEAERARAEATAARRLAVVEESLRRAEADAVNLRVELNEVKGQLAEERKARRDADSEAGRLRRRVADLELELDRSLSRPPMPASPVPDTAALLDRVAMLESRLAEPPPAVDPVPVQRALDALDRVRDELGGWLAGADERPAPRRERKGEPPAEVPRRTPSPLPPATFDDTVEAADHLVRLPGAVVLVDGYNVTKLRRPDAGLAEQRAWLVDAAGALAVRADAEIHLVFDGADDVPRAPAEGLRRGAVHVRYTEAGLEADDELLRLVAAVPLERPVVVVSDDRRVRDGAAAGGANVVGAGAFVALLGRR